MNKHFFPFVFVLVFLLFYKPYYVEAQEPEIRNLSEKETQLILNFRKTQEGQKDRILYEKNSINQDTMFSDLSRQSKLEELKRRRGKESELYRDMEQALQSDESAEDEVPEDSVYGRNIFRNRDIVTYQVSRDENPPLNYMLGTGDVLVISIWGSSEYNEIFEITPEGFIDPPIVGRIYLKGLTFDRAKKKIRARFSRYYDLRNSSLDVILSYSRSIGVHIVGEVLEPGTYDIPALNTAFNALMAAGGITDQGSLRKIFIVRENKVIDSFDVYRFLHKAQYSENLYLQDKDFILVMTQQNLVQVKGMVKRPMYYELTDEDDVFDLLEYCGGWMPNANQSHVRVLGYRKNKKTLMDIDLNNIAHAKKFRFRHGDIINFMPVLERIDNRVSVSGAVYLPGDYQYYNNMNIKDIIFKVQGLQPEAITYKCGLYRRIDNIYDTFIHLNIEPYLYGEDQNFVLKPGDRLHIYSRRDFNEDTFFVAIHGAVRKADTFTYARGMTLKDLLLLAGGLKEEASPKNVEVARVRIDASPENSLAIKQIQIIRIDIENWMLQGSTAESFMLHAHDQILVKSNPAFDYPRNVEIQGEVNYPGVYTLESRDARISDILERAGGLSSRAWEKGAALFRSADSTGYVHVSLKKAMQRKGSRFDVNLKEGDSIFILPATGLIRIQGKFRAGVYTDLSVPYKKCRRGKYYIMNYAGGYESKDDKKNTFVKMYNHGVISTRKLFFFNIYPKVRPGSIVIVPETKSEFEELIELIATDKIEKQRDLAAWGSIISTSMAALTSIISIILLSNR